MARKGFVGTAKSRGGSQTSVSVKMDIGVSRSSPADNMIGMRKSLMLNILNKVAIPMAAEMQEYARVLAPWEDQDRPRPGYPNGNARAQIEGSATQFGDIISIRLAHSSKTYEERGGAGDDSDSETDGGSGSVQTIFYGTILERKDGGKFAVLGPTLDDYRGEFEQKIANRGAEGINYSGANSKATKPTRSTR